MIKTVKADRRQCLHIAIDMLAVRVEETDIFDLAQVTRQTPLELWHELRGGLD